MRVYVLALVAVLAAFSMAEESSKEDIGTVIGIDLGAWHNLGKRTTTSHSGSVREKVGERGGEKALGRSNGLVKRE